MPDNPNTNPAGGPAGGGFRRPPQPTPLPAGGPRHTRAADDTAQLPVQRPERAAAGSDGQRPRLLRQRLQGAFLTTIGIAGIVGGVLFSIEAPRFTPVPVVFLTFWLVMVIVGRILFTGLNKLRAAGITAAPAPHQVRAAAAVVAIIVAVGMMGFAATSAGSGTAQAAPCPGGGPATCGPTGPELTFTPPPAQTNAPGGQQGGQQGGQDQQGIATSPAQGGNNGPGIQAQTPEFGTPGQQAPNIPGNEQPGQGGQQQPTQGQQTGQQSPVQTTAPGQPQQTGQPTRSGQQPTSTVTVTQTQSQCPAPGAAGAPGAGGPGGGAPGGDGGTTGGPDSDGKDGAPSWAYLVAEAAGVMAGRRRNSSSTGGNSDGPLATGGGGGSEDPTLSDGSSQDDQGNVSADGSSDDASITSRQVDQIIAETGATPEEVARGLAEQGISIEAASADGSEPSEAAQRAAQFLSSLPGNAAKGARVVGNDFQTPSQSVANVTSVVQEAINRQAPKLANTYAQNASSRIAQPLKSLADATPEIGVDRAVKAATSGVQNANEVTRTAAQSIASNAASQAAKSADPYVGAVAQQVSNTVDDAASAASKATSVASTAAKVSKALGPAGALASAGLDIASGKPPLQAAVTNGAALGAGMVAASVIGGPAILTVGAAVGAGYLASKGAEYAYDHWVSDGVKDTVNSSLKSAGNAVVSGVKKLKFW